MEADGQPAIRFSGEVFGELCSSESLQNYRLRLQFKWGTANELVCLGEDSIHIVNGKVVMRLHAPRRIEGQKPLAVTSGPIILQSEGGDFLSGNRVCADHFQPPEFAE